MARGESSDSEAPKAPAGLFAGLATSTFTISAAKSDGFWAPPMNDPGARSTRRVCVWEKWSSPAESTVKLNAPSTCCASPRWRAAPPAAR